MVRSLQRRTDLLGVLLDQHLELIVVQLGVGVGDAHEEPGQAAKLVVRHIFKEESPPERTVRGNACAVEMSLGILEA